MRAPKSFINNNSDHYLHLKYSRIKKRNSPNDVLNIHTQDIIVFKMASSFNFLLLVWHDGYFQNKMTSLNILWPHTEMLIKFKCNFILALSR